MASREAAGLEGAGMTVDPSRIHFTGQNSPADATREAGWPEQGSMACDKTYLGPGEVRTVDPITGGQKGSKLARFSLIPRDFLWALAEHYGRGARKYEDRNWERGYKWSLSLDALERHLNQWLLGEDNDAETGSSHLIAVAWHVIALWWWHKRGLGTNDVRPQNPSA